MDDEKTVRGTGVDMQQVKCFVGLEGETGEFSGVIKIPNGFLVTRFNRLLIGSCMDAISL